MNRWIQPTLATALLLFTSAGTLAAEEAGSAFADKTLEAPSRRRCSLPKPSPKRIWNAFHPESRGAEIRDLTGLEKCLIWLPWTWPNNQISDLSPLKDLKGIQTIDLSGNRIEDIQPLTDWSSCNTCNWKAIGFRI